MFSPARITYCSWGIPSLVALLTSLTSLLVPPPGLFVRVSYSMEKGMHGSILHVLHLSVHFYSLLSHPVSVCLCQMPWLNDFAPKNSILRQMGTRGSVQTLACIEVKKSKMGEAGDFLYNSFFVFRLCVGKVEAVKIKPLESLGTGFSCWKMNRCGRKNLPSHSTGLRLNGTSEFRDCVAGAGGALFARGDLNLAKRLGC